MKILITIHGYPPTHYAGAERAAERVALWLVAHGHQVDVFAVEKVDDPDVRLDTRIQDGVTVHRLYYDLKAGLDPFQNSYNDARVGQAFRRLLETHTYDVVHVISGYMLGGQVIHAAKEHGLPVVLTLTEFWFMCFRLNLLTAHHENCSGPETDEKCMHCLMEDQRRFRLSSRYLPEPVMELVWSVFDATSIAARQTEVMAQRRQNLKEAVAAADVVIGPSHFLIDKYREFGFDNPNMVYGLYGIRPPGAAARAAALRQHENPSGTLRLGYVGQIKPHKGVDLIIDAVLPLIESGAKVSLDLWGGSAGADQFGEDLKQKTTPIEAIRWRGTYQSDQLWEVLGGFDALIVPSRWVENSPTVILEAHMIGVPVICTRLGSMPELVEHGKSGLLFELNSADDLRIQIKRLLDEPALLPALRQGIPPVPTVDDEVGAIFAHYQRLTQSI